MSNDLINKFQHLSKHLRARSILITGATGYAGKNLLDILLQVNRDYNLDLKIYALARSVPAHDSDSKITWLKHDVTQPLPFKLAIDDIIHAATPVAQSLPPQKLYDTILTGTKNLIQFARQNGVQNFLNFSSGAVYGEMPDSCLGFTESMPLDSGNYDPAHPYATGKRAAEALFQNSPFKSVHARGFAFSGRHLPLDKHFAIGNFVNSLCKDENIHIQGDGRALRSYMDSEDMVFWLVSFLYNSSNNECYNLGSNQPISILDLANIIASFGKNTQVKIENKLKSDKVSRYFPDTNKAEKELGLKVNIDLQTSIKRMIAFQKEQNNE